MNNEFRITIDGVRELTEAVNRLAASLAGSGAGMTAQAGVSAQTSLPAAPQQAGTVQAAYTFGQPSAVMGGTTVQPPAQGGGQLPTGAAVPVTAMAQGYTIEQLQVAAAGLSSMGKMPQVLGILQQFGIQAMTELPRERYGDFAVALREAGAQI